jgi:hypothetical protein
MIRASPLPSLPPGAPSHHWKRGSSPPR